MKRAIHYAAWFLALAAAVFFFYALHAYLVSGVPPAVVSSSGGAIRLPPLTGAGKPWPSSRYAPLCSGKLFFPSAGEKPAATAGEPATYLSGLALRGIVLAEGRPPMAVLTRAGAPPTGESWMVRVGETVLGETVVAIDRESVTLQKEGKKTVLFLPGR